MATNDLPVYLTVLELKTAIGDTTDRHSAEHTRAISSASRQIDTWAGRYFYQDTAASARLFKPKDRTTVCVGDFDAASGVIVETDDTGTGTWTTWDDTAWQAEPFVRYNHWPYTDITTTTRDREFPVGFRRACIRVTAVWGWAEVPGPIKQATEYLATQFFRAKDQAGVMIGIGDETEKLSADPIAVAKGLVREYAVPGGSLYMPPTECC